MFSVIEKFLEASSEKIKIICVVGPTASGKTARAVEISQKYSGEIINADSRQMYAYMPIGTACPTSEEKKEIPHHLFEVINPAEEMNVALWKQQAEKCISEIVHRKNLPIFCGGTGLFINALTQDFLLPRIPPNPEFRKQKEQCSHEELWQELNNFDPKAAQNMSPYNRRYIIRALEICQFSPIKKSEVQKRESSRYESLIIGITQERKKIYDRINARVEHMEKLGFLEEVKSLMQNGYLLSDPGLKAHGYPEAIGFLQKEISEQKLWEKMKQNTRHYAKRQLTWWRRDQRVQWFNSESLEPIDICDPKY